MIWLKYPGAIAVMLGIGLLVDALTNGRWSTAAFGAVLALAGVGCVSLSSSHERA